MNLEQLFSNIPMLLGYILCIAALLKLTLIFFFERKNIIDDLRGKDKKWQFIELSGIVWLVLFPCVVISSLFGLHVPTEAWVTMDAVYFMNLGGKISNKWIDQKSQSNAVPTPPKNGGTDEQL